MSCAQSFSFFIFDCFIGFLSFFYLAVRLVEGNALNRGRVEILHNGVWGTICHDYWEMPDANVLCRQLGFEGALVALRSAAYGKGTGEIWLDDVDCKGNEPSIFHCGHKGWGIRNCDHSQDASVICIPIGNLLKLDVRGINVSAKYLLPSLNQDAIPKFGAI